MTYRIGKCGCCGAGCCCDCETVVVVLSNGRGWLPGADPDVDPPFATGEFTGSITLPQDSLDPCFWVGDGSITPTGGWVGYEVTNITLGCNGTGWYGSGSAGTAFESIRVISATCSPFEVVLEIEDVLAGGTILRYDATYTCDDPPEMMAAMAGAKSNKAPACLDPERELLAGDVARLGLDTRCRWFACATGEHPAHNRCGGSRGTD